MRPYRQLSTSLARTAASLMSMSLVAVSVVYPPITGMPLVPAVDGIRPRSGKAIGGQGLMPPRPEWYMPTRRRTSCCRKKLGSAAQFLVLLSGHARTMPS